MSSAQIIIKHQKRVISILIQNHDIDCLWDTETYQTLKPFDYWMRWMDLSDDEKDKNNIVIAPASGGRAVFIDYDAKTLITLDCFNPQYFPIQRILNSNTHKNNPFIELAEKAFKNDFITKGAWVLSYLYHRNDIPLNIKKLPSLDLKECVEHTLNELLQRFTVVEIDGVPQSQSTEVLNFFVFNPPGWHLENWKGLDISKSESVCEFKNLFKSLLDKGWCLDGSLDQWRWSLECSFSPLMFSATYIDEQVEPVYQWMRAICEQTKLQKITPDPYRDHSNKLQKHL